MNKKYITIINLFFAFAFFELVSPLFSQRACLYSSPVKDAHVEAELVSEVKSIQPGREFWIALRLKMDKNWHTYWKNPGDSGLATKIEWDLPQGFNASSIYWSYPEKINLPPLASYGYEGEVFLLTKMQVSDSVLPGEKQQIKAQAKWLACKVNCVSGKADLSIELPVQNEVPKTDERWGKDFSKTRTRLPLTESAWKIRAFISNEGLLFQIRSSDGVNYSLSKLEFMPERSDLIQHAAPQSFKRTQDGHELFVPRSSLDLGPIEKIKGIFISKEGWRGPNSEKALEVNVSVEKALDSSNAKDGLHVWVAMLFAFVGGLILNLMPCVLPVLSLKILQFVQKAGDDSSKMFKHGLIFTAGVLISFWFLAGLLLLLREGGSQIGWGFQLQSPAFLIFLAFLFFIFALNLFGVFEIGTSLTRLGTSRSSGWLGSFSSGILTTIVATPCTAPFMGSALGFALTQSTFVSLGVFTFLGLGMAFPYLFLSRFPKLIRWIPKPGMWMVTMKQFLGFLLMATVIWLIWVLGLQKGVQAITIMLFSLLILGMAVWVLGRWATPERTFTIRNFARLFAGIFFLASSMIAFTGVRSLPLEMASEARSIHGLPWESYSEERLKELRQQGRPVFIDFTAAWCLTCQVNERIALNSSKVVDEFKRLGIVALKADWTSYDENITRALAQFGRNSIPLYVLYGKSHDQPPQILPELLTPAIVLESLEKLEYENK